MVAENGQKIEKTYTVIVVEEGVVVTRETMNSQKEATLLTQIEKGNDSSVKATEDFLRETIENSELLKKLKRYVELKNKAKTEPFSVEELKLIKETKTLEILKDIRNYLPQA